MLDEGVRVFLFLQGPHGPFFRELAGTLARLGHRVERVAFNAADEAEWAGAGPLHAYVGRSDTLVAWLDALAAGRGVTDIVLYGDTRPVHRAALGVAAARGLVPHCLEEGYLRPHWITYEREGNNGNSSLMALSVPRMAEALSGGDAAQGAEAEVPATWGDVRQHLWHSARYHVRCLLPSLRYGRPPHHRAMPLLPECLRYCVRAAEAPARGLTRAWRRRVVLGSGRPFHLVLLQLSFDCSMQVHSAYRGSADFIDDVVAAYAAAGTEADLVIRAHPFEDGRERLARATRAAARRHGVAGRVAFIDGGGGLGALLDRACSAITINSTAAQQALARGLPVAALGRAVYRKPGLVSEQPLVEFLRRPMPPDRRAYGLYRRFLLATSQLTGSYYSAAGRARLLSHLPAMMLAPADPYARLLAAPAAAAMASCPALRAVG